MALDQTQALPGGRVGNGERCGGPILGEQGPRSLWVPVAFACAAVIFVGLCEARIQELNLDYRGRDTPTDVLAFPLDGSDETAGPRELGDVVICPEHASDVTEAAVHGVLHLCGYDHETDDCEMLALQAKVMGSR